MLFNSIKHFPNQNSVNIRKTLKFHGTNPSHKHQIHSKIETLNKNIMVFAAEIVYGVDLTHRQPWRSPAYAPFVQHSRSIFFVECLQYEKYQKSGVSLNTSHKQTMISARVTTNNHNNNKTNTKQTNKTKQTNPLKMLILCIARHQCKTGDTQLVFSG